MPYRVGIDLGTTFTAAAVCRNGESRAEIVSIGGRAASIPSVVFIRDDGTALTGDAANRRALLEPDRVAREFKRRLGDPTPLVIGGAPLSPEALSARLLRWVVDAVAEHEGGPADSVAVTYPANWGPYKRELFTQILRMAGLDDAIIVTEPEAAAVHYASNERVDVGSVIAVYDLGGGTFDAAVLRKTDSGFDVLGAPEGLEHLGGVDVDHAVIAHVNTALGGVLDGLDVTDPTVRSDLARLRDECVQAKEALSNDTEVAIPVTLPGVRTEVRLTRAELEEMVRPAIDQTVVALSRAVASAGIGITAVDTILLVGGASRMPIVARVLSTELARPVSLDAHPKHAIALGAALVAEKAAQATVPLLLQEETAPPTEDEEAAPSASIPLPPPVFAGAPQKSKKVRSALAAAVIFSLVLAGSAYALFLRPETATAAAVLYQDPVAEGPSPFTAPAVTGSKATTKGDQPFGGSGVLTQCDKAKLVGFLNENLDRRRAWLGVLGVAERRFAKFVDGLREATVKVDTRVTNHGFKNGEAFELQSILAKGTAVLVDRDGQIVTRCYCGNPLTAPKSLGQTTCTGCPANYKPPPSCVGAACYSFTRVNGGAASGSSTAGDASSSGSGGGGSGSGAGGGSAQTEGSDTETIVSVTTADPDSDTSTGGTSDGEDDPPPTPTPTPVPTPVPTPTATPCYKCMREGSAG